MKLRAGLRVEVKSMLTVGPRERQVRSVLRRSVGVHVLPPAKKTSAEGACEATQRIANTENSSASSRQACGAAGYGHKEQVESAIYPDRTTIVRRGGLCHHASAATFVEDVRMQQSEDVGTRRVVRYLSRWQVTAYVQQRHQ